MKWSMDTHKFMSEITRKALQIISSNGITSESDPDEIERVERQLADAGVYRSFDAAKGRVRRALFTYFKAYGCMGENEQLTEIGRLFAENEITVQEICFHYILNYKYVDDEAEYYPLRFILELLKRLKSRDPGQAFISAYDFSKLVECQSINQIDDNFVDEILAARQGDPIEVNERNVGFDVWSYMLIAAGITSKTTDRTLVVRDEELAEWILGTYEKNLSYVKGRVLTGPFEHLPLLPVHNQRPEGIEFANNGRALQAYLFDNITNRAIERYIFVSEESTFAEMISALGLDETSKGYYSHFSGLEKLIGYCLAGNENDSIKNIGSILASVQLTEADFTQVMPQIIRIDYDLSERISGGKNTLLYGVPGSGKSWTIEHEYCHEGSAVERLVFHPDYTNADFVGQILPVVDDEKQVTYEFTPGPFTVILGEAYRNPLREYILIIEEINRGNAPAIFGEVFQLLDRKIEKQEDDDGFPIGTSEYGVTHKYMAEYIYGDPNHKVRIPSNLSIVGTMNTSDQNVFTLDTAFQRRWHMRLIENNFNNVRPSLANAEILDTKVTWRRFCETVNNIIVGNRSKMASAEDKRLGVYFVHESEIVFDDRAKPSEGFPTLLTEQDALMKDEILGELDAHGKERLSEIREATMNNRAFPEKVIKYLWDDAFKFNPEALFDTETMESLEQVIRTFVYSKGEERFKIFKSTVRQALYPSQEQSGQTAEEQDNAQ